MTVLASLNTVTRLSATVQGFISQVALLQADVSATGDAASAARDLQKVAVNGASWAFFDDASGDIAVFSAYLAEALALKADRVVKQRMTMACTVYRATIAATPADKRAKANPMSIAQRLSVADDRLLAETSGEVDNETDRNKAIGKVAVLAGKSCETVATLYAKGHTPTVQAVNKEFDLLQTGSQIARLMAELEALTGKAVTLS